MSNFTRMNKFWIASLAIVVTLGLTTSCGKKKKENEQEVEAVAIDNAVAESSYNDLSTMADEAVQGESNFKSFDSDCVTIDYDTIAGVPTITVDFGPENCLCQDGRMRRGKVIFSFAGMYNQSGSVVTTTTNHYYVDDYGIDGTRIATWSADHTYNITVNGSIYKPNNGGTITWNCNKTRTQTAGTNTPFNWLDNVYSITGSASGTTATGVSFEITVDEALIVQLGCRWIKKGKLTITRVDKDDVIIDYGDGECDNKAMMTIGNRTKEITLSGW